MGKEILIPQDVLDAIAIKNGPGRKPDDPTWQKADEDIESWLNNSANHQEWEVKHQQVLNLLGVSDPQPYMVIPEIVVTGRRSSTGIIGASNTGTGLPEQEKHPRDLDSKPRLAKS